MYNKGAFELMRLVLICIIDVIIHDIHMGVALRVVKNNGSA